MIILQLVLPLL